MPRPTHDLPAYEAELLLELREGGPNTLPQLRARVAALREAGWSLAAVGTPLGANRSTTRMWQTSAKPEDVVESTRKYGHPDAAPPRRRASRTVRLYPDVPAPERDELVRLATSARVVRGHTPQDAQSRLDAREFERRLQTYVQRGVPVKRLAERVGVTHHAVAARLDRAREKTSA